MYRIGRSAKEEKAVVYVEGVLGMIPGVLVAYVCWFLMGAFKMYILPSIPHCFLEAWKDVEPRYMWYCGIPMSGAGVGICSLLGFWKGYQVQIPLGCQM